MPSFVDFMVVAIPLAYAIGAGIILLIWIASQVTLPQNFIYLVRKVSSFFVILSFTVQVLLSIIIIATDFKLATIFTTYAVVIQAVYLSVMVAFFVSTIFAIMFVRQTKATQYLALTILVFITPVFVFHLYRLIELVNK